MYSARKFVKADYDKYDAMARKIFTDHLLSKGYEITKDEEDFKHDVHARKEDRNYLFELEVKLRYPFTCKEDFKFDTVSFTGRKERLHKIHPFFYVIMDVENKAFVYCHSSVIYDEKYVESVWVNSPNRKGSDQMYRVPKEICTFVKI